MVMLWLTTEKWSKNRNKGESNPPHRPAVNQQTECQIIIQNLMYFLACGKYVGRNF